MVVDVHVHVVLKAVAPHVPVAQPFAQKLGVPEQVVGGFPE